MSLFSFLNNDAPTLMVFHQDALQLLQYKKEEGTYHLLGFNEAELRKGVVEEGHIIDMEAFQSVVAELFEKAEPEAVETDELYVNIPHHLLYPFVEDFPHHAREDAMKRSLNTKIEKYSPVPADELSIDFEKTEKGHKVSYAAYAAPEKWKKRLLQALEVAGVKTVSFVAEPVAQMALLPEKPRDDYALFSCHRGRISLSIFRNGLLYDSYHLDQFGEDLFVDCTNCMQAFRKADQEIEMHFKGRLQKIFFAGFSKDKKKEIRKEFEERKDDIVFIDPLSSPLSEILPYDDSKLILFGLFNYVSQHEEDNGK